MMKLIWLIPLLPLAGAAVNGLLGRKFRFSERVVGSVAVGSVALAFLLSLAAVVSYGYGDHARWPEAYVTSEDGGFGYTWIPGGAVEITQGAPERARADAPAPAARGLNPVQHSEGATGQGGATARGLTAGTTAATDPAGLG